MSVYDTWKTLRNFLSKLDLNDSLAVIRYYSVRKMLSVTPPVPNDIELHSWADRQKSFLEWDLESLAREVLFVCNDNPAPSNSMKTARGISSVLNKLRAVEDSIADEYISQDNIMHEVSVRLAHRQFKYQAERPNWDNLIRYGEIYSHKELSKLVEENLGVSAKQIYTIGLGVFHLFTQQYGILHPLQTLNLKGVSNEDYEKFMSLFACTLNEIKERLSNERHYDDQFFYAYHSLYEYPIILTDINKKPAYVCPIPTLLYWKITSGLYYKLYKIKQFDNVFGSAYESYVGKILQKTFNEKSSRMFPGEDNTDRSPNRIDWIIDQLHDVLFIECKVKRPSFGMKASLSSVEKVKQLDILGDAVRQAYQSYVAYRDGTYRNPIYTLDQNKRPFIAVVTLERWYVMGEQARMLDAIVRKKLKDVQLPESLIEECPYIAMNISDLEELAYLARSLSISDIFRQYIDEDRNSIGAEFTVYLSNHFKNQLKQYRYVLRKDHVDLFTIPSVR